MTGILRKPVVVISKNAPPRLCGVGDYAHLLARGLRENGLDVQHLVSAAGDGELGANSGASPVFRDFSIGSVRQNVEIVLAHEPSAVLVQFSVFGQGRWGITPGYAAFVRQLSCCCPVILTLHEPYAEYGLPLRKNIYSFFHRRQLQYMAGHAAAVIVTTQERARTLRGWPFGFRSRVNYLPVPSNFDDCVDPGELDPPRYGLRRDLPVVGIFGFGGLLDQILEGLRLLSGRTALQILLIGWMMSKGTDRYHHLLDRLRQLDLLSQTRWTGPLDPKRVSHALHLLDVGVVTEGSGSLTKSGCAMALLSHAVPTVAYLKHPQDYGDLAAAIWEWRSRDAHGVAEAVSSCLSQRAEAASKSSTGRLWYEREASWQVVSQRYAELVTLSLNGDSPTGLPGV